MFGQWVLKNETTAFCRRRNTLATYDPGKGQLDRLGLQHRTGVYQILLSEDNVLEKYTARD